MSRKSSNRKDKINYVERKGRKNTLVFFWGGGGELQRVANTDTVIYNSEVTAKFGSTWYRTNTLEDT